MNTKVLPNEIRRLLNQPRQLAYLVGLGVVIALGAVLFLTVLRVQNAKDTITRPQAAEPAECTAVPGCCNGMSSSGFDGCSWPDRGWCKPNQCSAAKGQGTNNCANGNRCSISKKGCSKSGPDGKNIPDPGRCGPNDGDCEPVSGPPDCQCGILANAYCGGGGGGGGGTNKCGAPDKDIACANNCVDNIRVGNCSYCKACCAAGNCSKTNSGGGSVTVKVKNSDGSNYNQSGTVRMLSTSVCSSCNANCADPVCSPNRDKSYSAGAGSVSWPDSTKGATYSFTFVGGAGGTCTANAGGQCTITIGGSGGGGCQTDSDCTGNKVCVAGTCTKKGQTHFECVSNACQHIAGKGTDQAGCSAVGASCGSTTCQDANCPTGQACFNNSCQAYHLGCGSGNVCSRLQGSGQATCNQLGESCGSDTTCDDSDCSTGQACFGGSCKAYHFGCTSSNVCAKLEGAGANTSGCVAAGQVCGGELGSCWGNGGVNGRCVDCNGDGIINILDFSCLACNWSEKFTPDQNPSCRTTSANEE